MPEEVKKKKKKKASKPVQSWSAEQARLLELLPVLKETEKRCRQRYQAVTGYEVTRSTSEEKSLGDLLRECQEIEKEVASLLDGLAQSEVADLAVPVVGLLDAGSSGFFAGSRHAAGKPRVTDDRVYTPSVLP